MRESLILGFRDLFRNKKALIVFEVSILLICMIVISASNSLMRNINVLERPSSMDYIVVPTSTDMSSNTQLVNEINQLLTKGGTSFFYSDELTKQVDLPVVVMINPQLYELKTGSEKKANEASYAKIYTSSVLEQTQNFGNVDFPDPTTFESNDISEMDERIFEYYFEDEVVIIHLQTSQLDKWIDTQYGLEILELVKNVRFGEFSEQEELVEEFEALMQGSFLTLQPNNYQSNEVRFILFYVYPTVAIIIASLVVALTIMYVSLFKNLYREYTIHLISGATLKHIYMRNSVFIITLIAICLMGISFLNRFQFNRILGITFVTLLLIFIVFEILLYFVLRRRNISMNLKGDI